MLKVNINTVETLQLLAPGISSKDRITVKGLVHSGEVFSNFTTSERSSIWKQMKKKEGIIPSLHTFFKDLWYLESCANCMKRLITPTKCSPTIKSAMRAAFLSFDPGNAQFLIQTSETGFRRYAYSQVDPAELGYRQLWLYAMRHYPKLFKKPQKKKKKKILRQSQIMRWQTRRYCMTWLYWQGDLASNPHRLRSSLNSRQIARSRKTHF